MRHRIRVTGTVQGVGFRPFVYREATTRGLTGWVRNDSQGVLLEVEGSEGALLDLARRLAGSPPPLARVTSVRVEPVAPVGEAGFVITESVGAGAPLAPVGIDTATCQACLAEVTDPANRRHRYPFTNCTDCGPRYTIVRSVPYDRPGTTMAGFTMCRGVPSRVRRPARSALPRPAQRLPGLWSAAVLDDGRRSGHKW